MGIKKRPQRKNLKAPIPQTNLEDNQAANNNIIKILNNNNL